MRDLTPGQKAQVLDGMKEMIIEGLNNERAVWCAAKECVVRTRGSKIGGIDLHMTPKLRAAILEQIDGMIQEWEASP